MISNFLRYFFSRIFENIEIMIYQNVLNVVLQSVREELVRSQLIFHFDCLAKLNINIMIQADRNSGQFTVVFIP